MTHGTARLFIEITVGKRKALYSVTPIPADTRVAPKAWRLANQKASYDVAIEENGYYSCTCADSTYRSHGNCKHVRSLKALGLLPQTWHKEKRNEE